MAMETNDPLSVAAARELLQPEQEIELGQAIEARDVQAWTALLSYAPVTEFVLGRIEAELGNETPPCCELRRAAGQARRSRSPNAEKRLARAARDFSQLVRPLDLDRHVRRNIIAQLRAARRGDGPGFASGPDDRLGFRPSSTGFREMIDQLEECERIANAYRERFIRANLRLVVAVARAHRNSGLPFADLVQEGNLGLMKAVDRYDHRRGTRFSTFAVWWIRHTIGRAVADKSRLVRVPVHLTDSRRRINSQRGRLAAQLGRAPTVDELASTLDLSAAQVERLDAHPAEVVMSLDAPVGGSSDDTSRAWHDSFAEMQEHPDLVQQLLDHSVSRRLDDLLAQLRPIEADVLRRRFGLGGQPAQTLREIAAEYDLSRERIRQIEQAALSSLRERLMV